MSKTKTAAGRSRKGASVMHKLLGIVGVCLISTAIVAVIGIWQMGRIGDEIDGVAKRDIPLTELVNHVIVTQLEQAVVLERAMRLSGLATEASPEELRNLQAEFEQLSASVDAEIARGIKLAEAASAAARTESEKAEFQEVISGLQQVGQGHRLYHDHAAQILKLAGAGNAAEAIAMVDGVEGEEAQLDGKFEALLKQIQGFTDAALQTVDSHEQSAIAQMTIISIASALVGFALAAWFTRTSVARPLSEVAKNAKFGPDLERGEFVYSVNIGAYSHASATYFNGFPPATVVHVNE